MTFITDCYIFGISREEGNIPYSPQPQNLYIAQMHCSFGRVQGLGCRSQGLEVGAGELRGLGFRE